MSLVRAIAWRLVAVGLFVSIVVGCESRGTMPMNEQDVLALVRLYQKGQGSDDTALEQLFVGGNHARALLVQVVDNPDTPQGDAATAAKILVVHFASNESFEAMERLISREVDPEKREKARQVVRQFRESQREHN